MEKYIIFDVDGTLNQTTLYAIDAYKKLLEQRGIRLSEDQAKQLITPCMGLPPEDIMNRLLGRTLVDDEYRQWREDIEKYEYEMLDDVAKPFPGIEVALETLQKEGYHLMVCSNAYPKHIHRVLKAISLESFFTIIGSLELGDTKVKTLRTLLQIHASGDACMVGDRKFDLEAARKNGIPMIGCAYGYAPDEIREADIIITHANELVDAVKTILG